MNVVSRQHNETAYLKSACMKWQLVVPALFVVLNPVYGSAEEATFLGANAEIHYVRQGAKGKDGAYHQYVVYGKGDDGAWGENGPSMSLSYEDAPIIGRPGFAGIYLESSGGQGGRGGGGTSGFYSIGGYGGAGGAGGGIYGQGGFGRGAGNGGTVSVENWNRMVTDGNSAKGIFAQSIGGGNADSSVGLFSIGGSGSAVNLDSSVESISTSGTYSSAIFAQSIGGGRGSRQRGSLIPCAVGRDEMAVLTVP